KPKERRKKILFINAVNEVTRERAQSFLTNEHIQKIVQAYEAFQDQPGFAYVATIEEISSKQYNLSIPLFVSTVSKESTASISSAETPDLMDTIASWIESSCAVSDALHKILPEMKIKSQRKLMPGDINISLFNRKDWCMKAFGDFVQNVNERVDPTEASDEIYVGLDDLDSQNLQIRRWGKGSDVIGTKLRFHEGDIIFGRRRAYQRKLAVAKFDGICSAHAMVVRAKPDLVLPEFLPFLMMSDKFMNRAVEISVGSLSPTINWTTLKSQEFNLPPLGQQYRIAEILWAVDELIQNYRVTTKAIITSREAFFQGIIAEGCSLAKNGKNNVWPYWRKLFLSDVVEFLDDQRRPIKESERSKRSGPFPYYGASGVIDSIDDYLFNEPLILLGEDGANIVDRSTPLSFRVNGKIWVNNHAHVLRVKPPNSLIYLEYFLESLDYKNFVTGTAQPKLTKGMCERLQVLIPDYAFQAEIEDQLRLYEKGLTSLQNIETQIRCLFIAFLNHFSTG
ncbi:MAG: restriction endonuclease subunit S, partial [Candidatus Brocadiae bacterium]|nr:restriction endonuclease subunit S [Candidatus Brocadiia bacterium]